MRGGTRGGDAAVASTPWRFVVSRRLHFPPCPGERFSPSLSFSLLQATLLTPRFPGLVLYLALRTYSVFPSPRPIYLPPCVAEWILFVSHRYFAGPPLAPLALQNCLAATIYVSSDPAAD